MATNDRNIDSRKTGNATGPGDNGGSDEREIPLDIRETRDHLDVDEEIEGFQRIIGPGAGPLPPRQPERPQGQAGERGSDRIVSDRNVAVDGARDRE